MDRILIKNETKEALVGNRLMILIAMIVIGAICGTGFGTVLAPLLAVGLFYCIKDIFYKNNFDANRFLDVFKDLNYSLRVIGVGLLTYIIIGIGLIIFVIPGIVLGLMYSQAIYLIGDDKQLGIMEALNKSSEIMLGHKWDLFVFNLSFIGHYILIFLTFGLYGLYILPYIKAANVNYYLHLTKKNFSIDSEFDL